MLAVTASVSGGLLTVTGTSGADNIKIYQKSATNEVTVYDGSNVVRRSPFSANGYTQIYVDALGGNDTVTLGSTAHGTGSTIDPSFDIPVSDPAEIHGGTGTDTLSGTDEVDTIEGEEGSDTLNGAAGNDWLYGEEDNDTINGETGNDTIVAMPGLDGADVLNGGVGTDTADYSNRSAALKISIDSIADDGALDADPINSGNQTEGDNVKTDIEVVLGGSGNDSLNGSGNADTLKGGDGNDVMYGGFGNDDLDGGAGTDIMYGNEGNDTFHSADTVADSLFGGSGSDTATDRDPGTDFLMDIEIT